jgi:flagellar biosynthesis protein FliQ
VDAAALALLASDALSLALKLALPALAAGLLSSLVVGLLQASTNVHDAALGFLPKLAAVGGVLLLNREWLALELTALLGRAMQQIAAVAR